MTNFRYPLGDGTREDFEKKFYVALEFGAKQSYGFHEGADLNKKTGGDTDLGEPIYSIADWKRKYYHLKGHLESGFGEHYVYEVQSPWGPRWIHCAHNQKSINFETRTSGVMGEKLSEIDKTGRPRFILPAHLHLSVFKVDPAELPNGIDTIAKSRAQLLQWWDDPIEFFKNWYDYKEEDMDLKQLIIDLRLGLLGKGPSDDELKWDLAHWENPKAYIERLTGDNKFYQKHILPQLNQQKTALESGCNTEKDQISLEWQKKLETAKKEADVKYATLELKKVEHLPKIQLLAVAFRNLFTFIKRKRGR